ncbi:MAG: NUDIX domain-containing protein [Pirellula sp.]
MEISEAYRFCPICGTARLLVGEHRPFKCQSCRHTSFFGPVTAVGGVIANDKDQILLIERARDPGLGKLGMPGGFVDPNESADVALRREIREEVGIDVGNLTYLMTAPNTYLYNGVYYPVLDIYFHAFAEPHQIVRPEGTEVSTWLWTELTLEVLDRMAFPSNRHALEHYLNLASASSTLNYRAGRSGSC